MTDRVQQILAKSVSLCVDCGKPVSTAGQVDNLGQPAHLSCQLARTPEVTA